MISIFSPETFVESDPASFKNTGLLGGAKPKPLTENQKELLEYVRKEGPVFYKTASRDLEMNMTLREKVSVLASYPQICPAAVFYQMFS